MNEPFLILHKVRGEAAFDVAIQMHCPLTTPEESPCAKCDCDIGYWWIIPTSGHRAYPVAWKPLRETIKIIEGRGVSTTLAGIHLVDMSIVPDHYRAAEPQSKIAAKQPLAHKTAEQILGEI